MLAATASRRQNHLISSGVSMYVFAEMFPGHAHKTTISQVMKLLVRAPHSIEAIQKRLLNLLVANRNK